MKISVIIPVHNAEKWIEACISSVLVQRRKPEEILIIDDGSTDGTRQRIEMLVRKSAVIRCLFQEHQGVSVARNLGIQEAKGDWLLFLDADDELLDNCFLLFEGVIKEQKVDACCGGILRGREKNKKRILPVEYLTDPHEILNKCLAEPTDRLTVHGWVFRREIAMRTSIFFRPNLHLGEDSEWVLRYLKECTKIALSQEPVYRYRIDKVSSIHSWKPGRSDEYLKTLSEIEKSSISREKQWPKFVLTILLLILTHDTFHPANPATWREQIQEANRLRKIPVFRKVLTEDNFAQLLFTRRMTLRFVSVGLMIPVRLAVRARQQQNVHRA